MFAKPPIETMKSANFEIVRPKWPQQVLQPLAAFAVVLGHGPMDAFGRFGQRVVGLGTQILVGLEQAAGNDSLKPFDIEILRVLFLIRYVDEIKGNIDNLVTLCIDQIDADRLAIKKHEWVASTTDPSRISRQRGASTRVRQPRMRTESRLAVFGLRVWRLPSPFVQNSGDPHTTD